MNRSEFGVLSCGMIDGIDIVGECVHHSVWTGLGAMEFGVSAWRRVGGMEHNLIASVEGRAMCLCVVGSVKMFAGDFFVL